MRVHGAAVDADGAVGAGDAGWSGDATRCGADSWLLRREMEPRIKERMVATLAELRSRDRRCSALQRGWRLENFGLPTRKRDLPARAALTPQVEDN